MLLLKKSHIFAVVFVFYAVVVVLVAVILDGVVVWRSEADIINLNRDVPRGEAGGGGNILPPPNEGPLLVCLPS